MEQLVDAIVLGAVYCLFALGLSLTWGTLNVLNLAHGAVFMFSAFTCYLITQRADVHLPIAAVLVVAVAAGALVELCLDLVVFRPIKRRSRTTRGQGEAELSMLIGSIGASAILVTIAEQLTADTSFTVTAAPVKASVYHLGPGVYVTNIEIIITVVALALTIGFALWIQRSQLGRALRAIAYDAPTSGLMGISEGRMSALAMLISGASAGAAGVFLTVYLDSVTADSGSDLLLKAFAVVVLGGVGSMWGTLIGAFILAGGETLVTATTSGMWTSAVSFGLIIVVLLVRPSGLFGKVKGLRA
jgi:branched-chain amino acid transport system permease protein